MGEFCARALNGGCSRPPLCRGEPWVDPRGHLRASGRAPCDWLVALAWPTLVQFWNTDPQQHIDFLNTRGKLNATPGLSRAPSGADRSHRPACALVHTLASCLT